MQEVAEEEDPAPLAQRHWGAGKLLGIGQGEREVLPLDQVVDQSRLLVGDGENGVGGGIGVEFPDQLVRLVRSELARTGGVLDAELFAHLSHEMEVDRVDHQPCRGAGLTQLGQKALGDVPERDDREVESVYVADRIELSERSVDLDSPLLEAARVALRVRGGAQAAERHLPASAPQHFDRVRDTQQAALAVVLRQPRGDHQRPSSAHRSPFPIATTRACGW